MKMTAAEYRKSKAKVQPETLIKRQVDAYLTLSGWFVFPILQGLGAYKGISDKIAIKDGRVIFLELKSATGRQSEHQKAFEARITAAGGEYRLVRSLDDLRDLGL